MEKFVVVLDKCIPKKHSVRYDATDGSAGISSVYVSREKLGLDYPKAIRVTVEEISPMKEAAE